MKNTYILDSCSYTYENFSSGGFSGKILLATPKHAALPRLLIKSENPYSACNEFMTSRLAEQLDIQVPKAYMINVDDRDKHHFSSPYVVGIEYIDGLHSFTLEEMRASFEKRLEYAKQYALAVMIDQSDRVQMSQTPDGHIISFDFTETFRLCDLPKTPFFFSDDILTTFLVHRLNAFVEQDFSLLANAGATVLKKELCAADVTEVYPDYLEPMKALCQLSKEKIEELTNVLSEFYPDTVSVYFEEYIDVLKEKISSYLISLC